MAETFVPRDARDVAEAIAWAAAEGTPLALRGRGSKEGLGRPVAAAHMLDLSRLAGVSLYEPEELVLTAGPATPLAEIETLLAQRGQELAFEPPDWGPLLGGAAGAGTLGGALACNLAGPRRFKAGAARDHFLGAAAVSGRGEAFRTGGRVVKNVTGYDMCKLLAGSYGTLAALTEVTVKVVPRGEKARTVLVFGLDGADATRVMSEAGGSPHEVSGLAYLPARLAARSAVAHVAGAGVPVTAIRVEGPARSVEYRCAALRRAFAGRGATEELHSANSGVFWRELRDVAPFAGAPERVIWRLSVAPSEGPAVAETVARVADAEWFLDWAGGLVWLGLPPAADGWAQAVRAALPPGAGHATLIRAPAAVRAAVPVFQPEPPALAALARRVKESFDPANILNPGRMAADG
jgi:glycolate oxidase FAD binding subunit